MKKINYARILTIVLVAFILIAKNHTLSQCACAGSNYGTLNVSGWTEGQTAVIATNIWAGERSTIQNTVAGAVYQVSTCGASYDTQLTIYTTGCSFIAYNDDNGPACSGSRASVNFTSPGGDIFAKLNRYNCATNSTNTTVRVTLISLPCQPQIIDNSIFANGNSNSITVITNQTFTISSSGGNTPNMCYWASDNGGASWDLFAQSYCNQSSFNYSIANPGTYLFHVRNSDGCGYCWDNGRTCSCNNCVVTVNVIPPAYQSSWVSMNTGPANWCAGETRDISVTVSNIGSSPWTNSGPDINIGVKWNEEPDYIVRVDANNLAPGTTGTYNFTVTAPQTPGTNNLSFDVVNEGNFWFANNTNGGGPGNVVFVSPPQTINAAPSNLSVTASQSTSCVGDPIQLNASANAPVVNGSQSFTWSGSGDDCNNFFVGGTTSGMPANAIITGVIFSATIASPSGTSWCPEWYEMDFWINNTYLGFGCNGNYQLNNLNGLPANGQLLQISSWDNDWWCDFVNMSLTVTVNYTVPSSLSYTWTPAGSLNSSTIPNPIATPTTNTTYNVQVSSNGCSVSGQVTVNVNQPSTAPVVSGASPVCPGTEVTLTATGGTAGTGSAIHWYTGPNGTGTFLGTGASYTISAVNATQTIYARREGTCNTTGDASFTIVADAPQTLGNNADSRTCVVNQNSFVHFTQNGRLIASVNSNGQNLGNVTATSYVHGSPLDVPSCDNPQAPQFNTAVLGRSWVITPTNQPASDVTVRLYFDINEYNALDMMANSNQSAEDNVVSLADLMLTKYNNSTTPALVNNSPLDNCPSGQSTIHAQVTFNQASSAITGFDNNGFYTEYTIPSFSEFWLHGSSNMTPLPVTLTYFDAYCDDNRVNIVWQTASENNSSYFVVQKSEDGQDWREVGKLNAAGHSNVVNNYELEDKNLTSGATYYRLLQVDLDGEATLYDPIMSDCEMASSATAVVIYPNPTVNESQLRIMNAVQGKGIIQVVDLTGKVLTRYDVLFENAMHYQTINANDLAKGSYMLHVSFSDGSRKVVSFVKQ